jgi:hypothetical protein
VHKRNCWCIYWYEEVLRVSYLLSLILLVWLGGWLDSRLPWPRWRGR